jgi:hypothetical protein
MKHLEPGDRVELRDSLQRTEGVVEWVSADGQRLHVRWVARPGLDDQQTTEIATNLRKLAAA